MGEKLEGRIEEENKVVAGKTTVVAGNSTVKSQVWAVHCRCKCGREEIK